MQRALTILFFVGVAAVSVISLVLLLPASRRLNQARARVVELERELAERNSEVAELRQFLDDLQRNPGAVEKVAREKFGLCREGETVFLYRGPAENAPRLPGNSDSR